MSSKATNGHVSTEEPAEKSEKKPWWHINKDMLRYKAHFIFFIGAMGTTLPYIPVIAKNRIGVSATSLAVVFTSQQFITMLSRPIVGYITDYFNRLKLMLIILIIIQTIFHFLLLVIPPIEQSTSSSQITKDLMTKNQHTEISILNITNCEDYESYNSSFLSNNTMIQVQNTDYVKESETACMTLYNDSKMICYKKYLKQISSHIIFPANKKCNCSISSAQLKLFTDSLQIDPMKSLFYVTMNEPAMESAHFNESFTCSLENFKENGKISLLDEPVTRNQFATYEFWIFAIVILIASICTSSIFTLGDTACYESVQKYKSDYGRQRAFGSIGWGGLAPIAGLLCDLTNGFLAAWILMLALQVLTIWNISKLDLVKPHFPQDVCKNVRSAFKSVRFLAFTLAVFMNGFCVGLLWFYLVWFLTSMGGSKFLLGLVMYVECFGGEIPFMFLSGWFIQKLGHFNLMSLALFCYAIRFLWYSYLQNPWWVFPVEILHGFTYGTLHPTVASFGKLSAKPGAEATTQAILFATYGGLGAGLGCIVSGIGFDYLGGNLTFYYFSLFSFCACLLNLLHTVLLHRKRSQVLHVASTEK